MRYMRVLYMGLESRRGGVKRYGNAHEHKRESHTRGLTNRVLTV